MWASAISRLAFSRWSLSLSLSRNLASLSVSGHRIVSLSIENIDIGVLSGIIAGTYYFEKPELDLKP